MILKGTKTNINITKNLN